MDAKILKMILCSYGEENLRSVKLSEGWDRAVEKEQFPPTDEETIDALAGSFTSLLSFRVSQELTQRYSVRFHILKVLREWSRPLESASHLRSLAQGEKVLRFVANLLNRHFDDEILNSGAPLDSLLLLARALIRLLPKNPQFMPHLNRAIDRIARMDATEESGRLLRSVLDERELQLDPKTIDLIYANQSAKLVEEPVVDAFLLAARGDERANTPNFLDSLGIPLGRIVESPRIFQLVANVAKEILANVNFSQSAVDFIQSMLRRIETHCTERQRSFLDLYPRSLLPCVILLRIDPSVHTPNSKERTLKMLKKIWSTNESDALILLSHFPRWLELSASRFGDDCDPL